MKLKSTNPPITGDINHNKPEQSDRPIKATPLFDMDKHKGYGNKATYELADAIKNDPALNDLCRCLYEDGYKSAGAMLCKLREYSPKWQSNYTGINSIHLKDDTVKCSQITAVLEKLFKPQTKPKTK